MKTFEDGYRQALEDIFAVGSVSFTNSLDEAQGKWTTAGETSMDAFHSIQRLINSELGLKDVEWYMRGKKVSPLLSQFVYNLEERNISED